MKVFIKVVQLGKQHFDIYFLRLVRNCHWRKT